MFSNPHEGMSEGSIPTNISSSKVPPPSTPAKACPPWLACPVSGCPFVLNGATPHRYLKRHLNHPGVYGRKGQEKEDWLNLHKREHERLLEDNRAEERNSRTAEFELRARTMGITEERFIAQKVAIWEGMWAAEQDHDDIGYCAGVLLDAATGADQ